MLSGPTSYELKPTQSGLMSSCMPRTAPAATNALARSSGLTRPPAHTSPPLASTPTPPRAVATPATDAPHAPGFDAAAVGAPPSTRMPRFCRSATTALFGALSRPHEPTEYAINDASPPTGLRYDAPNAITPPSKSPHLKPPLNDDTRNGCWSGATWPPHGEPSGSPVPGTTTGRVSSGSIHATKAPLAEPV